MQFSYSLLTQNILMYQQVISVTTTYILQPHIVYVCTFFWIMMCCRFSLSHIYIYVRPRFPTTPHPPQWYVPKTCVLQHRHENAVFAVFVAWWLVGAVCKPANSLDLCNLSRTEAFAMFRLRHLGVMQSHPLLCQGII